jgi:hypothetical protein
VSKPKPLEISCRSTKCGPKVRPAERRHSFRSPVGELPGVGGECIACGKTGLVDWERCWAKDPSDIDAIVDELRKELIRDAYWGEQLPERITRNASRRSGEELKARLEGTLQRALVANPFRDGIQTPFAYGKAATIAHCAQHATGTCCRKCLEKWFAIPRGRELSKAEWEFVNGLAWQYELRRLDDVVESESK